MLLSDRKLLNQICYHANRGENRIVSDLIFNRLKNLAHSETIEHLEKLLADKEHKKLLEEIPLYKELYPEDEIIQRIETENLIMTCMEI